MNTFSINPYIIACASEKTNELIDDVCIFS